MQTTLNYLQIMEIMDQTIIPSYSSIPDGEAKDMPTMAILTEKEMMIPEGRERVETQEDHQDERIQIMTLMGRMKMTPQMATAPQHQAVTIQVNHLKSQDPNFLLSTTSHWNGMESEQNSEYT